MRAKARGSSGISHPGLKAGAKEWNYTRINALTPDFRPMSSRTREPDMNMPQLLAQGRRGIGQKGIPDLCLNSCLQADENKAFGTLGSMP